METCQNSRRPRSYLDIHYQWIVLRLGEPEPSFLFLRRALRLTCFFPQQSVKNNFNDINAKDRTAVLYDAGESEATVNTTTLDQAARAIVSVLQKPEETKNRHVYVSSFAITGSQLLKAYEDILGGEKFKVTHASTEELEKNAKERLGKGDQTAVYDLIKVNIWRRGAGCDYGASKELDNELLGLPKEDLHAVLAEALGV